MRNCFSKRSAVILPLLLITAMLLYSCASPYPEKEYVFGNIPYEPEISFSYDLSPIKEENVYILYYDVKAEIPEDREAEEMLNSYFSLWKEKAADVALGIVNNYRKDYFKNAEEVVTEAESKVTFLDGGLVSIVCRLKYSYYGTDFYVFLGGETLDLKNRRALGHRDILKTDDVTVENILTAGFAGQFPKDYREEVTGLGGNYAERSGIFVENGKLIFFLDSEEIPPEERIFSVGISMTGNEKMFLYDISEN